MCLLLCYFPELKELISWWSVMCSVSSLGQRWPQTGNRTDKRPEKVSTPLIISFPQEEQVQGPGRPTAISNLLILSKWKQHWTPSWLQQWYQRQLKIESQNNLQRVMFLYQEVACDCVVTLRCIVEMSLYQITRVWCQTLVVTSYVMTRSNRCHLSIQTQTSSLASCPALSAVSILIDKELPVTVTLINIIVSYKTNVYPTPYFYGERGIYANWHRELDIKWNVWWQSL